MSAAIGGDAAGRYRRRERCGRHLKHRSSRCRRIAAAVADDVAARVRLPRPPRASSSFDENPRVEPKVLPRRCWSLRELPRGEDVMVRQIEELLLLTCLGGFVAGITYAVALLH